jgi:60 kDa SS-A/Ro ribonucleoprotein
MDKDVDKAAYQTVKYQNREGYSHRDLFRLSHPMSGIKPFLDEEKGKMVFASEQDRAFHGLGEWILRGNSDEAPAIVKGFVAAHKAGADVPALIRQYGLSWEMVPTESLNKTETWDALLDGNVPLGALLRQLPRLTRIGVIKPLSKQSVALAARLTDPVEIERARIHPIAILTALKTYASGRSVRGDGTWTPVKEITNALDAAFYLAFKNVEPTGNRVLIGLDVSGSMDGGWSSREGGVLTPREATAAVALVTEATEPYTHVIGFTANGGYYRSRDGAPFQAGKGEYGSGISNLDGIVSHKRRLDDVISDLQKLPMGLTDCSLPMLYALEEGLEIDTFVIMTDNETFAGKIHVHEALNKYRKETGIPAKLVVFSTEASRSSIVDPNDAGSLDIAGFDSAAPQLLSTFMRGDL